MEDKWAERFMSMAELVASWSKDPSTKVGAVLTSGKDIVSLGYNGFPPGTSDDPEIYNDRPRKYLRVVHAEANALLMAHGKRWSGDLCLFSTLCPCSTCAAMAIRFGVKEIFTRIPTPREIERWGASFQESQDMLKEADVRLWFLPR
jgi:dCMP deaminase